MASGVGKRLAVVFAPLALVAALLPAAATAAGEEPPGDLRPVLGEPTLQVSPELAVVAPGTPIQLTARLSHASSEPVDITFESTEVDARPRLRRPSPPEPTLSCTVAPAGDSCSVVLSSEVFKTLVVTAWVVVEGAGGPDRREGRLANLVLPPRPEADCRLEDGEPLDDRCRGDGGGGVSPGADEPDNTDVVLAGWSGLPPVLLDCDDQHPAGGTEREVRPSNQRTVTYRCTVLSRATREPVAGARLNAEIMGGPFDPDAGDESEARRADYGERYDRGHASAKLCTTTAPEGHCEFDFTVPGEGAGEAVVCFWADGDGDATFGPGEFNGGGCAGEAIDEAEDTDGTDVVAIRME